MQITVYSIPNCNVCKMIKQKLENGNYTFDYIEDIDKTIRLGSENSILSAPVIKIDDKFYNAQQFAKELNL